MFKTVYLSVDFVLRVSGLLLCSTGDVVAQTGPVVGVMTVRVEDVSPAHEFVGRVEALNAVDIRARVEGFLERRLFAKGQNVEKGQDLFTLERTAYELALEDAQAALVSARTNFYNAERQFQRNQTLSQRTVSQAVLEESQAARDTARANVLSAQTRVSQAELNLGYTHIKAPIGGRIGRAAYSVGSLVSPSSEPLARVVQIQVTPVYEIREHAGEASDMLLRNSELGASLAKCLDADAVVLMRGHGMTVVGKDVRQAVFRAVYTEANARIQMNAMALGAMVPMTPQEAAAAD